MTNYQWSPGDLGMWFETQFMTKRYEIHNLTNPVFVYYTVSMHLLSFILITLSFMIQA